MLLWQHALHGLYMLPWQQTTQVIVHIPMATNRTFFGVFFVWHVYPQITWVIVRVTVTSYHAWARGRATKASNSPHRLCIIPWQQTQISVECYHGNKRPLLSQQTTYTVVFFFSLWFIALATANRIATNQQSKHLTLQASNSLLKLQQSDPSNSWVHTKCMMYECTMYDWGCVSLQVYDVWLRLFRSTSVWCMTEAV